MVNFGPPPAEIGWRVWGTPANVNRFRVLASLYCTDVVQGRSTKLCTMFIRLLRGYTMYTFSGLLPPNGILPGAKFTIRPNVAFSNIDSVTARHSSSGRQTNFAAFSSIFRRATITLGIGPHSSFI